MSQDERITFVAAVNNQAVFESNFLSSTCFRDAHSHQILVQERFASAAYAYNDAIRRSVNDLIVFAHQDVSFPAAWTSQLQDSRRQLETSDPNWGVLGCYGETSNDNGRGCVYSPGRGILGKWFTRPEPVQTLDEIVLIIRRSSGLIFDERLPHFHLYGAGICMSAAARGMKSYAIPAFCIHNTEQTLILPKEFYECCARFKRLWFDNLPIQTTCMRFTKAGIPLYQRRLQEVYLRYVARTEFGARRLNDVQDLLLQFDHSPQLYMNFDEGSTLENGLHNEFAEDRPVRSPDLS
jgi:hypothetical protein